MSRQAGRELLGIAAIAAAALAAAGCSSGTSSTSGTQISTSGSSPSPAGTAAQGPGGAGSKSVTSYLAYTGGRAGKADSSLSPVYIGWINQQGGQQTIGPLATAGAQMAVKYVNAELGGIDGHPVALKTCFITSAEEEGPPGPAPCCGSVGCRWRSGASGRWTASRSRSVTASWSG